MQSLYHDDFIGCIRSRGPLVIGELEQVLLLCHCYRCQRVEYFTDR
jgi:hypothetical protein